MKKSLSIIILLLSVFVLFGCKEKEKSVNPNTPIISEISKKGTSVCCISISFTNVNNINEIEYSVNDSEYFQLSEMDLNDGTTPFIYFMQYNDSTQKFIGVNSQSLSVEPKTTINVKARYKETKDYKAGNASQPYTYYLKEPAKSLLTTSYSVIVSDNVYHPSIYFTNDKYEIVYSGSNYNYYLGKLVQGNENTDYQGTEKQYFANYTVCNDILNYEYALLTSEQATSYQVNYQFPTNLTYTSFTQNTFDVAQDKFYANGNFGEFAYMIIRVKETPNTYESYPSIITIQKPVAQN